MRDLVGCQIRGEFIRLRVSIYDKGIVQTIRVDTPSAKYAVMAGSGLIESLSVRIERVVGKLPRRVFVLTSAPIWALWHEAFLRSFA